MLTRDNIDISMFFCKPDSLYDFMNRTSQKAYLVVINNQIRANIIAEKYADTQKIWFAVHLFAILRNFVLIH